ncbi:class I glutamine amidotransferase-like protein [Aspergillus pseudonomiae]|uniref:Class I glutamine amidotransferase-like protein n=1 Tax=Aspergillus pseudonomiae TaxID=1506151 RepID=A0A5N6HQ44_9EURO|nr:class I glutamine amidotransferase-like protein [Aspergillus pseudonomiae]KAB8255809.1 class I glutamine amidotransferase-like protein [Aspergillus pseudonomiae]KAE8401563.1 class I glutamine amidotransferase-like protein [Aspergillus pseudonomiae]
MRPPLRIAILECDTPIESVDKRYNGYYGLFSQLFRECAKSLGLDPEAGLDITRWDVVHAQEYPKLEDVDAIVQTGSKHDSFENDPWILKLVEYTQKALQDNRVKLLGICFGHQIIGRALGVKVGRSDAGWELAVCNMDLTDQGKKLFGKDKLRIHQMHRDIVHSCPPTVIPLGSSPKCALQGMYLPGKLITVQGHPEYNGFIVTEIVNKRTRDGVFSKEQSEDALARTELAHDGFDILVVFLQFLLGEIE